MDLNESSKVFDDFEKESMHIDKNTLKQVQDLSLLVKIRNLASELKNKKEINGKLHSLHFNLNLAKNASVENNPRAIKALFDAFLHSDETKIDTIINELNEFKTRLDEIKKYHSKLLPKSLDNKLKIDAKYHKHVEYLYSIHKRQKSALISATRLFLKLTKNHVKSLQKFKNKG